MCCRRRWHLIFQTHQIRFIDSTFNQAQKIRSLIKSDYERVFVDCDVLLTPSTLNSAPSIASVIMNQSSPSPVSEFIADSTFSPTLHTSALNFSTNPPSTYNHVKSNPFERLNDVFTVPSSLAGFPLHFVMDGLGVQVCV